MDKMLEVRLRIQIDTESCDEHGVTPEDVAKSLKVASDDALDGCTLTTNLDGFSPLYDFFLGEATIVDASIVGEASADEPTAPDTAEKRPLKLEILPEKCGCGAEKFKINGVPASIYNFGAFLDKSPETAPIYGCGNMCFVAHAPTEHVLKTYGITIEEFREIADTLVEKLHIGSCDYCN